MREAAARPVIVPDTIVIDHGQGVRLRHLHPGLRTAGDLDPAGPQGTPTDKGVVEATFDAIKTLFAQHVAGYTGCEHDAARPRRRPARGRCDELQDLLDEWLIVGWQHRPHDALRDPHAAAADALAEREVRRAGRRGRLSAGDADRRGLPGAAAGGVASDQRLRHPDRLPHLRLPRPRPVAPAALRAGARKRGLWEVHYDPYDVSQVFVRTPDGWITVAVDAPADGRRAVRRLHLAPRPPPGRAETRPDDTTETEIARVLDDAAHPRRARPGSGQRTGSPPAPAPALRTARGCPRRATPRRTPADAASGPRLARR